MNETVLKKVETERSTQVESSMTQPDPAPRATLRALRDKTEIFAISQALEESGWNRKRAAKLLSISYRGLLYKIRQHNITPNSVSSLSQASRQEM